MAFGSSRRQRRYDVIVGGVAADGDARDQGEGKGEGVGDGRGGVCLGASAVTTAASDVPAHGSDAAIPPSLAALFAQRRSALLARERGGATPTQ
jgi:hypothetical protein